MVETVPPNFLGQDAGSNELIEGRERRRDFRKEIELPLQYTINVPNQKQGKGEGTVKNLGPHGMLFKINTLEIEGEPMMKGDPITLILEPDVFTQGAEKLRYPGHISRFEQNGIVALGVCFSNITKEAEKELNRLLG